MVALAARHQGQWTASRSFEMFFSEGPFAGAGEGIDLALVVTELMLRPFAEGWGLLTPRVSDPQPEFPSRGNPLTFRPVRPC